MKEPTKTELLEKYSKKPVTRFRQYDGFVMGADCVDDVMHPDKDGHCLMGVPETYELMETANEVRVLIGPTCTKEDAWALLLKIAGWIERDGLFPLEQDPAPGKFVVVPSPDGRVEGDDMLELLFWPGSGDPSIIPHEDRNDLLAMGVEVRASDGVGDAPCALCGKLIERSVTDFFLVSNGALVCYMCVKRYDRGASEAQFWAALAFDGLGSPDIQELKRRGWVRTDGSYSEECCKEMDRSLTERMRTAQ